MVETNPEERLDSIIANLTNSKAIRIKIPIPDVLFLIHSAKTVFESEPSLLELKPPLNICGDIHGQFSDLLRLLELDDPIPSSRYLFLGDYVDRGPQSLEVIRGNHECREMTELYGFAAECITKQNKVVYIEFCQLFERLPIAAIISNRIFCVHGGLSPQLNSVSQIKAITRPVNVPETGLLADLLWSDPDKSTREWGPSERGVTYVWGLNPAKRFLAKSKFSVLVRAHQCAMQGIEFPFSPDRSVITVFSAPAYVNEFKNKGAVLKVDTSLVITTAILNIEKKQVTTQNLSESPRRSQSASSTSNTKKRPVTPKDPSGSRTSPIRRKAAML